MASKLASFVIREDSAAKKKKTKMVQKKIAPSRPTLRPQGQVNPVQKKQTLKASKAVPKRVVEEKKKTRPDCENKQPASKKICALLPKKNTVGIDEISRRKAKELTSLVRIDDIALEYEDDIWNYLRSREEKMDRAKPRLMSKQIELTWEMRSLLIDWLVSVADEYQMSNQTIHLSVNYLDRFLSNISVIRGKFQLVGAASMLISGKVEEIYPPDPKEWSYITADTFSLRQIIKMEQLMLRILNFDIFPPTAFDFIQHLCGKHSMEKKVMFLAMYISELVLLEGGQYLNFLPSQIAAAAVALSRHTLMANKPWPKKFEESSGYSFKQISPVIEKQQQTFRGSPYKKHQSIRNKYTGEKYQKVALSRPKILLFENEEE